MYKRRSLKRRNKIINKLANTRKLLLAFAEEYRGWRDPDLPWLFSYSGRRPLPYEDRLRINKAQARRALYDLKQKQFIKTRKEGDKMIYILTDKGRVAAIKEQVRIAEERRDGKILLISFDIPVQANEIRAKFRYLLKDFEFSQIHKSLWASHQDIGIQLTSLIKEMGAQKWIKVFISSEMPVK